MNEAQSWLESEGLRIFEVDTDIDTFSFLSKQVTVFKFGYKTTVTKIEAGHFIFVK